MTVTLEHDEHIELVASARALERLLTVCGSAWGEPCGDCYHRDCAVRRIAVRASARVVDRKNRRNGEGRPT